MNPNDADVHVDFTDEVGDSYEEYIVYHKKFLTWMEVNGIDTSKRYTQDEIDELVARSPYHEGENAGRHPEVGGPLYQRDRKPS